LKEQYAKDGKKARRDHKKEIKGIIDANPCFPPHEGSKSHKK